MGNPYCLSRQVFLPGDAHQGVGFVDFAIRAFGKNDRLGSGSRGQGNEGITRLKDPCQLAWDRQVLDQLAACAAF